MVAASSARGDHGFGISEASVWCIDAPVTPTHTGAVALKQISHDPGVGNGVPFVTGTNVAVAVVNSLLAEGLSPAEIVARHPSITVEDVDACSEYARNGGR